MKIAIFDIGTNSIHMKIVEIHEDLSFEMLEHKKDMTRIGEGSFRNKKLSKKAVKRAVRTVSRFAKLARKEGVHRFFAIATSAVRDAKNNRDFLKELYKKSGVRVRVISGEEEARLIYLGMSSGVWQTVKGKILSIDIGGGSAEFVFGDKKKIDFAVSLPLGVARLKDRFLSKDPPSKENLRTLEEYAEEKLEDLLKFLKKKKNFTVLGTAGTMINLASMVHEVREGRPLSLRGLYEMKRGDLLRLNKKMVRMGLKKRKKVRGLDRDRADIIVAGSILVSKIMKLLGIKSVWVSDKGVREGVLLDIIRKHGLKRMVNRPSIPVQWFGQKPFFSGRIIR